MITVSRTHLITWSKESRVNSRENKEYRRASRHYSYSRLTSLTYDRTVKLEIGTQRESEEIRGLIQNIIVKNLFNELEFTNGTLIEDLLKFGTVTEKPLKT